MFELVAQPKSFSIDNEFLKRHNLLLSGIHGLRTVTLQNTKQRQNVIVPQPSLPHHHRSSWAKPRTALAPPPSPLTPQRFPGLALKRRCSRRVHHPTAACRSELVPGELTPAGFPGFRWSDLGRSALSASSAETVFAVRVGFVLIIRGSGRV